jgi:hypothetical protein
VATPPNPAQAEALGQDHALAAYGGREWSIPLDVDTWPLDRIRTSLYVGPDREIVVNHVAIADGLSQLLGQQWEAFAEAAPRRRDLVPASNAFAAAVGFPAGPARDGLPDKAWGAIPRLLAVLDAWPTAVESDLHRFWGIDYRDRWRGTLTLRQIHVRLSHLPADSALAIAMGRRSPMELLLMDIYEPLAGRAHPARPLTPEQLAERQAESAAKAKALADYEARRTARGDRVSSGLANARENAERSLKGR